MLLLTGCDTGIGPSGFSIGIGGGNHHVGMGTRIDFPLGVHNQQGIDAVNQRVVAYFDAAGYLRNHWLAGGSYRQLLAVRRGDLYLVQDFYVDNGKKRTDPMLISKNQLTDFAAYPVDGSQTLYYPSGNVHTQAQYRNGKVVRSQSWPNR